MVFISWPLDSHHHLLSVSQVLWPKVCRICRLLFFCATGNCRNLALAPDNYTYNGKRVYVCVHRVYACVGGQLFTATIMTHMPLTFIRTANGYGRYKSILSPSKYECTQIQWKGPFSQKRINSNWKTWPLFDLKTTNDCTYKKLNISEMVLQMRCLTFPQADWDLFIWKVSEHSIADINLWIVRTYFWPWTQWDLKSESAASSARMCQSLTNLREFLLWFLGFCLPSPFMLFFLSVFPFPVCAYIFYWHLFVCGPGRSCSWPYVNAPLRIPFWPRWQSISIVTPFRGLCCVCWFTYFAGLSGFMEFLALAFLAWISIEKSLCTILATIAIRLLYPYSALPTCCSLFLVFRIYCGNGKQFPFTVACLWPKLIEMAKNAGGNVTLVFGPL